MATTPIRRRRYSEPDYDVPRPHTSLQILPRTPHEEGDSEEIVIPATRFFGPVLPTNLEPEIIKEQSMHCRSMTPDSLEPLEHPIQPKCNNSKMNLEEEKNDKEISNELTQKEFNKNYENNDKNYPEINKKSVKSKSQENFLDSLETNVETSTVF